MVNVEAEEAKRKGNDCVKEKKYIEAMLHYTHAVKLDPKNHLLYSNRSLAFLKMDQYYHAMEDACKVIELQPQWAKGYFRKGEVESMTEHFHEALISYRQGLLLDPDDVGLQEAVGRTTKKYKEQKTREARMPLFGGLGGAALALLIVLGDDILTPSPALNHVVLKFIVFLLVTAFGYGAGRTYRYFIRSQRDSLREAPIDIFTGEKDEPSVPKPNSNADSDNNVNIPSTKPRKGGSAAARQRYKLGKS